MVSFGEFLAEAYRRPSNVDWCETNHAYSEWVAEMGNTLSSVPMCGVAFYGLYRARRHLRWESRWFWAWFMLAIVGVGSALFHATLRHVFQAADELPMLYCNLCFAYLMIEERASFRAPTSPPTRPSVRGAGSPRPQAAGVIQTYFYFAYPSVYEVFMVSYVVVVLCLSIARPPRVVLPDATKLQRLLVRSPACHGGGAALWIFENVACGVKGPGRTRTAGVDAGGAPERCVAGACLGTHHSSSLRGAESEPSARG